MNYADTKMAVEGFQPGVLQHAPEEQMFTQPNEVVQNAPQQSAPPISQPMTQPLTQTMMGEQPSMSSLSGATNYGDTKVEELGHDKGDKRGGVFQ